MHGATRAVILTLATVILVGSAIVWRGQVAARRTGDALVYVALGASDAVGIGASRPAQEGWVPLVWQGLPEGTRLINLGVSGATLREVLADQVPVAADASARWITIWPGPNDLRNGVDLATFATELEQVLRRVDRAVGTGGPLTIGVMNLPDLRGVPAFAGTDPAALDAQVRRWNAVIAEAVQRHAATATLIDLYANWPELAAHPEYVSADGFHPSSAGYRRVADLALDALKRHDATIPH